MVHQSQETFSHYLEPVPTNAYNCMYMQVFCIIILISIVSIQKVWTIPCPLSLSSWISQKEIMTFSNGFKEIWPTGPGSIEKSKKKVDTTCF